MSSNSNHNTKRVMLSYYANRLRVTRNPLERQALLILLDWL
ncbi:MULTISPECIES: hypothetical protein [Vibrio]|nr:MULTISPECIES: hypothetical protein [Vibrio]